MSISHFLYWTLKLDPKPLHTLICTLGNKLGINNINNQYLHNKHNIQEY
jgi:hypothetical protein